ncbi:hypothetical protein CONLIGDRAFT_628163 [Coniochaeta ligniaria NRRL 30616]|uniref:non-specific serine/threonine protein kinase n=1 Tax=Coniochaeta ligniaria NRRL 30616 TaxID=1408157 RepID=A0A1J7JV68_9PEZI|nr:hypothetical protein CONLIGDRAFT_628163 [Coniochaeta ligniaria NRRL 30616]
MASFGQTVPVAGTRLSHAPVYGGGGVLPIAPAAPAATAPAGTFAPGTKIQVGGHRVIIQKYLSEGGFAHVYLVKMPTPVNGTDLAVLKRVAVPDKESLRGMRTEVETMKRLKGHKAIVTYIDSHASELRNGNGYEVFLLMEYCNGGGLIDFMNTRLQHRLTEPEIVKIFADVAEGVACMHYLKPPLLHRDLKVENVLITTTATSKKFKLCDFGSAAPPRPAPTTTVECRLMDEDVQKHTTMQYRSPEMIDVYRKQPIDEKSDIWALGVLLYKLCYYTTPFEEQGQLAILNASYKFPSHPAFSERLKKLIASMLRENPKARPNIYQVLKEACAMQGREVPVKDIYSGKTPAEPPRTEGTPRPDLKAGSAPVVGAVFAPPVQQQTVIPEVERMRRGRPPPASQLVAAPKPSRSPAKVTSGDPFAALDSKSPPVVRDELSSKFPTLDEFALLVESDSKFDFERHTPPIPPVQKNLAQRVTERLADEAFAAPAATSSQRPTTEMPRPKPTASTSPDRQLSSSPLKSASAPPKPAEMSRASAIISNTPELQALSSRSIQPVYQPTPTRPTMVSTGTNTTPPPERSTSTQYPPIYRFPPDDHHRSSSVPRQQDSGTSGFIRSGTANTVNSRPSVGPRPPSFQSLPIHARHPSSSRPSLEGGRPSMDLLEPVAKSRSASSTKPRPASTHLESNIDYLREREALARPLSQAQHSPRLIPAPEPEDETNITSNVDFLRSMEDTDPKKKEKTRHFSHHAKRSSLTSLGAGTKNILAGKFGDAFKRFETNNTSGGPPPPPRTPSPLRDLDRRNLTPIAGSEATDGRSDDGNVLEETDDMPPEMRREMERRRLSMEEKRVAAAGAEYRQRVGSRLNPGEAPIPLPKSIGGVSRAVSIQNKVQSLLEESNRSAKEVSRTAQGYGPYADAPPKKDDGRPVVPRKTVGSSSTGNRLPSTAGDGIRRSATTAVGGSEHAAQRGGSAAHPKPAAPPKPTHLNTMPAVHSGGAVRPASPPKPRGSISVAKTRREHMVAVDLPGQPVLEMSAAEREDYIRDFQKRFPSLTSFEMVEADMGADALSGEAGGGRAR